MTEDCERQDCFRGISADLFPITLRAGNGPKLRFIVANQYPGGDYFEFGSEGFRTFRNFLSAFHLNGHTEKMPDVKILCFRYFR